MLPDAGTGLSRLCCPSCGRHLHAHKVEPFGEADWLTCNDPVVLANCRRGWPSARKCRLFACACWPLTWVGRTDPLCLRALQVAEWMADGLADTNEVARTRKELRRAAATNPGAWSGLAGLLLAKSPSAVATAGSMVAEWPGETTCRVAALFRDIAGNPFRPPKHLPASVLAWNDGTVVRLARAIDEERAFDRLPILADALEEAGCGDSDLVGHCRSVGPHAKGCWAVDLVLGRT